MHQLHYWDGLHQPITQGGPKKLLLETIDYFVVNSNFCEPPRIFILIMIHLIPKLYRFPYTHLQIVMQLFLICMTISKRIPLV